MRSSIIVLLFVLFFPLIVASNEVRMGTHSRSKICHDENSRHFKNIKRYKVFKTMEDCLKEGGRVYVGYKEGIDSKDGTDYDRKFFNHWVDEDRDCLNTRHELLESRSEGPIVKSKDGCRILKGKWYGSYSGNWFNESREVDIDHIVPLEWAWYHGAHAWKESKRETFANDPDNLIIADYGLNRSKGSKSPLEWMPPDISYKCEYVEKFINIVSKYELKFSEVELVELTRLKDNFCLMDDFDI